MVSYGDVIQVGVAILLIIITGFLLYKLKLFKKSQIPRVNKFVFRVCYIPMLMRAIASKKLSELSFWPFLIGTLMNLSIQIFDLFFFALPLEDSFANYLGVTLSCSFVNYLVIGMPILQTAWPGADTSTLPIFSLSNDLITTPTYQIYSGFYLINKRNKIHERLGEEKEHFTLKTLGSIFARVIQNPIIIGNILGFLWAATGLKLPIFLDKILTYGNCVITGLSLMMCGAFLAQGSIISCAWWELAIAIVIRHFIMPALVILYCWAVDLDHTVSRMCVVLSSLCTAATAFLMSSETHIEPGIASTMVLWTTVLMIPAAIMWLSILDATNLFPE